MNKKLRTDDPAFKETVKKWLSQFDESGEDSDVDKDDTINQTSTSHHSPAGPFIWNFIPMRLDIIH